MKLNKPSFISLILILIISFPACKKNGQAEYKDPNAPIEKRVEDLLSRMTLEEKFWQLYMIPGDLSDGKERYKHGIFGFQVATQGNTGNEAEQLLSYSSGSSAKETAERINEIQRYFIEETRLGIPIIPFDESLHGLVRKEATAFPQSIALAATFDTTLMRNVAHAIAMETKSRGIRQILSPVLNIARDVRWGRTEETYGEDPFLTSQMAYTYISEFENNDIITTPKHFIANVGDGGRDSYPIHYNERLLEEIYFPAFKKCITEAGAQSIMTSYNSLDGRQCTANDWLLNKKLKDEWNFDGFVISDAGATGGANVLHFTAKDYSESTKQAIENGLDVIFQTSYNHYPLFYDAFEKGMINETAIDNAVRRVLRAKFKLGLFENPYVNSEDADKYNGTIRHREIAKISALESIVLLKNENNTLPLSKKIRSLAVIGTDAIEGRLGGYSGPGNKTVNILDGIKNKIPDANIQFAEGCGRSDINFNTISTEYLYHDNQGIKTNGLCAKYYNKIIPEGTPDLIRTDATIDFNWSLFSPAPEIINYDFYSAKWEGKLIAPESGIFNIGIEGNDGFKLYLNNELIIDNWKKQSYSRKTEKYLFKKGESYSIRIEFFETTGNVKLKLIWDVGIENNWKDKIDNAVNIAKKSDAILVVAGIDEGEFQDRAMLSLPGHQEKMILKLTETGKPVIVMLIGGSAITMQNWIDQTPALLEAWYPGDEGGNAIADVLFGDYNPAGRLPISFPLHESQLPLYYNHKPTGRGDDYINLSGKPLYPFGYGLSYTQFKYSDLHILEDTINVNQSTKVSFNITNTGLYDGDEVVQLYIKDLYASVARPIMELKGFKRIHLKTNESKQITFVITNEMLQMLDENMNIITESGEFRIMIGKSSQDIRLRKSIWVKS